MKDRRMRISWLSNGIHTNSGYGAYSRDILFRMARDGWQVCQVANWGVQGYPAFLHGEDVIDDRFKGVKIKLYPPMNDQFGSDALYHHSKDFKANVAFVMLDIWGLQPDPIQKLISEGIAFVPYAPIDKDPAPPNVLEKMKMASKIISFSKFGQKKLEEAQFSSTLILEGTDTELFKPMDKQECRRELHLPPDLFIFGMVAANKENPPRKGFQEALEAFKLFQDKHPEAGLFIHTQQPGPAGFPVIPFASHIGINMKQFFLMDEYTAVFNSDFKTIRKEMNAMDVLLHPSQTEGFGLTVVEAASCGTPAIVNNTTSMPEMVIDGVTGEICQTKGKRFTNDLSWVEPADVNSLHEKMESIYEKLKKNPTKIQKACRDHIVKNYNIDTQYETLWIPVLEKLQTKLLGSIPEPEKGV